MDVTKFELTNPQKSIWLVQQFYQDSTINSIAGYLKINTKCDFKVLEKAFNLFVKNNDAFRLKILNEKAGVKQYVDDYIYESIPVIDVESDEELERIGKEFVKYKFILNEKLFNVNLARMSNGEGLVLLNAHHLISDAWTMILCLNEVYENYIDLLNGKNENEFDMGPSYIDFINSQKEYYQSTAYEKDKIFWNTKFEDLPDYISFKTDEEPNIVSNRKVYKVSLRTMKKVTEICEKYNISIYVFFLSVFSIYLKNVFNSNFYTIGNPVLNRSNYKQKHTAGMFVSTEPFVVKINDNSTFIEHAQKMSKDQSAMYRHIKYPYEEIYEYVKEKYKTNNKLFDIVFSYQNAKMNNEGATLPIEQKWFQNYNQIESLMIHLRDVENSGEVSILYDYLVNYLDETKIDFIHNSILSMIEQIYLNNDILVKDIEVVSKEEKRFLENDLNQTKSEHEKNTNLVKRFEEIVDLYPNRIAVSCEDEKITYLELNERANALAKTIIETNIDTEIIAFEMRRSIDMIVTIWGILKSGHTYMPIDPEYPDERKEMMIKNSKTKLLITQKKMADNIEFNGKKIIINDERECKNLKINIKPSKKAYIMYTSGSTGVPKAVCIRHENVLNYVSAVQKKLDYEIRDDNKVLSVTTVGFDIFVFELFPTLLSGLEMVVATEMQARSPKLLSEIIIKNNINKILTTPSRIQLLFLKEEYLECLKVLKEIILGGEPFPKQLLRNLKNLTKARIINMYGPTETTVYSTFKDLTDSDNITVGKPIDNTQIYLWNDNNKLVPYGSIGEIAIGGEGVGDGYYNNEKLTNKVFVEVPYKGKRIYKTGDFGKWNEYGELICLGRKDFQVKIRGYRIELDDITNNIVTFKSIEKAVVIDKEDSNGNKYLCAYYVAKEEIDVLELKKYLTGKLPNYMLPKYFMQIDEIPLTINHKINRKALPEIKEEKKYEEVEIQPKTEIEKILCNEIKKELKLKKLGIQHDLFDFQIDSLDIINIQTNLLQYKFDLNTQDFYEYRTIEELAKKIENKNNKYEEYKEEELKNINSCVNKKSENIKKVSYKCVLLTGCTGYLGMQVLHDIMQRDNTINIICLTRSKENKVAKLRIEELYKFYFNENINLNRVEIIETDITRPKLGLTQVDYERINKVDLVINCAANVRYYGKYEEFKKINVDITQNLIDFCMEHNILFAHISTLGVSGNHLVKQTKKTSYFDENSFYIGQKYNENVYIHTKFEAEKKIYDNIPNGLKAVIFRVGNLTGRYKDGHFQKNIEENAFYNILLVILRYSMVPSTMLNQYLEFTPVDLCSKAMLDILWHTSKAQRVYHLFNKNYIKVERLIKMLEKEGIKIEIKDPKEFHDKIVEKAQEDSGMLKGLVNDLDLERGLSFKNTIKQENKITNNYLKKIGFEWKGADQKYIHKIIKYIKENNML